MQKKLLILGAVVSCAVSQGFISVPVVCEAKTSETKVTKQKIFDKEVSEEVYQKAIAKGFLGKKYGTGKGRYLCNTYIKKALEKVANKKLNKTKGESFKNLKITTNNSKKSDSTPSSYDWNSYRINISFTDCVYDGESDVTTWEDIISSGSIRKKNSGTDCDSLELGQVLTYSGHVALYFGEYEGKDEVAERLIELGVYKEGELIQKKDRYVDKKGRTIIRDYDGFGNYWRIHATYSGLLIDNSIVKKSAYNTGTSNKWKKTISTGFRVVEPEEEPQEETKEDQA